MNPNNDDLNYLLSLPTPRLLKVFQKVRGQLSGVYEWDWDNYKLHEEELNYLPENVEVSRWVSDEHGRPKSNPLYKASQVRNLVNLRAKLKAELDKREHVAR
jgi:hypothetical protein